MFDWVVRRTVAGDGEGGIFGRFEMSGVGVLRVEARVKEETGAATSMLGSTLCEGSWGRLVGEGVFLLLLLLLEGTDELVSRTGGVTAVPVDCAPSTAFVGSSGPLNGGVSSSNLDDDLSVSA